MYLYCFGDAVLCGIDTLLVNEKPFHQMRIAKCLSDVFKEVFEFPQADISVTDKLIDKFT